MKSLSIVFQVLLGVIIGSFLFITAGAGLAYYFYTRLAGTPPKPNYATENTQPVTTPVAPTPETKNPPVVETPKPVAQTNSETEVSVNSTPKPKPPAVNTETQAKVNPTPKIIENTSPGIYKARVIRTEGLNLRSEPNINGDRLGGVRYNEIIVVLEQSQDGQWQKIRIPQTGQQGWVRANNARRL